MRMTCTHSDTPDISSNDALDDSGIIPFADECGASEKSSATGEEHPQPERDSAREAFGPVGERVSVADRELGIERDKWERRGKYSCPCCNHATSRVVRVRVANRPRWSAVCAVCAATLLAKVPGTIVGGMIRPTRRRRRSIPGQVAHGFRRLDQSSYRRAG
ncbi:MAG: hypothetical protein JJ916_01140 [Phycisphaerales bacterium]|nr:hypothetical protein [Phycisphaerales bacterium]